MYRYVHVLVVVAYTYNKEDNDFIIDYDWTRSNHLREITIMRINH